MKPHLFEAELERSIRPCEDGGGFVRIRRDKGEPWRYIGRYSTFEECLDAFAQAHQELHGIDSPYFDTHHRPSPKIVAACAKQFK